MKISFVLLTLLLSACSGSAGSDGTDCHTEKTKDGARIWCDDGTQTFLKDGQDGADGDTGADGQDGAKGADGQDGKDGSPAEATHITESFFCTAPLENSALNYTYNAVLWSSGDLFVAGSVSSPLTSASKTALFTPTQNGYQNAVVTFTFDQDGTANNGWFKLSLDRRTLVSIVEYSAADPGPVTNTWTLEPSACVHNKY
jgi:hypothetical protein